MLIPFPVRVVLIALLLLLLPSRHAPAQTSLQIPLQFDFVNPGAKSLALAGAFAGVADDATASFANPAGLMFLEGPEVSAEIRGTRIATPFLSGGRLSGQVTNLGVDTVAGPVFGDSVGSHFGLGYFSVVYPHPSRRWVVAGYRHELQRVDQQFTSQGAFQQDPTEFTSRRDFIQDVVRKVSIDGYGAAGAYKLTPSIAVGGGIVVYRFDIDSTVERFLSDGFFGPVNRVSLALRATQLATDVAIAPTVGATFDHRATRFGVVYRGGPTFRYDTVGDDVQNIGTRFAVPHVLAFGVSTRTSAGLLIAAEVSRILYSRIERDFVTSQARGLDTSFQVDDGTELHVGVQYALQRQNAPPIRLRAGSWYDPDHSVKFRPAEEPDTAFERLRDERLRVALLKGAGQIHVTGGVGWTLAPRLEFNAGADVSARARLVSASVIVRLGKGL